MNNLQGLLVMAVYLLPVTGTVSWVWWRNRCHHDHVRCIHGDEIISTTRAWRRPNQAWVRCTRCHRALYKWDYPKFCYYTGSEHHI